MRAITGGVLMCVVGVLSVGCARPHVEQGEGFVPVVRKVDAAAWPFALRPAPVDKSVAKPAASDARMIRVRALFIAGKPEHLAELGVDCKAPASVVSCSDRSALREAMIRKHRGQVLTAPRLLVRSGQLARIAVTSTTAYLADYEREGAAKGEPSGLKPLMRRYMEGVVLDVRAELDGEAVTFTHIDARHAVRLATRECRAAIGLGGATAQAIWEEPVILAATAALPATSRVRVGSREALVIPLHQRLVAPEAGVRSLAKEPVAVREERSVQSLARLGACGCPLEKWVVLVLQAEVTRYREGGGANST